MNDFKWRHFQGAVILWAVRWYCKHGISYRNLEEMLEERGVDFDTRRFIGGFSTMRPRPRSGCAGTGNGLGFRAAGGSMRPTSRSKGSESICTGPSTRSVTQLISTRRRRGTPRRPCRDLAPAHAERRRRARRRRFRSTNYRRSDVVQGVTASGRDDRAGTGAFREPDPDDREFVEDA